MTTSESMQFGPQWIQDLCEIEKPVTPIISCENRKFPLAQYRYSHEEMLALLPNALTPSKELLAELTSDDRLDPISYTPLTEDELRMNNLSVNSTVRLRQGRGGYIANHGRGGINRYSHGHDYRDDIGHDIENHLEDSENMSKYQKPHVNHDSSKDFDEGDWRRSNMRDSSDADEWTTVSMLQKKPEHSEWSRKNRQQQTSNTRGGHHERSAFFDQSRRSHRSHNVPPSNENVQSKRYLTHRQTNDSNENWSRLRVEDSHRNQAQSDSHSARTELEKNSALQSENRTWQPGSDDEWAEDEHDKQPQVSTEPQIESNPALSRKRVKPKDSARPQSIVENDTHSNNTSSQDGIPSNVWHTRQQQQLKTKPTDWEPVSQPETTLQVWPESNPNTKDSRFFPISYPTVDDPSLQVVPPQIQPNAWKRSPTNPPTLPMYRNTKIWLYKDPQNQIQGPFETSQMAEWFTCGYFDNQLLIKRTDRMHDFRSLGELTEEYGRIPFLEAEPSDALLIEQASAAPVANIIIPQPENQCSNHESLHSSPAESPPPDDKTLSMSQKTFIQQFMGSTKAAGAPGDKPPSPESKKTPNDNIIEEKLRLQREKELLEEELRKHREDLARESRLKEEALREKEERERKFQEEKQLYERQLNETRRKEAELREKFLAEAHKKAVEEMKLQEQKRLEEENLQRIAAVEKVRKAKEEERKAREEAEKKRLFEERQRKEAEEKQRRIQEELETQHLRERLEAEKRKAAEANARKAEKQKPQYHQVSHAPQTKSEFSGGQNNLKKHNEHQTHSVKESPWNNFKITDSSSIKEIQKNEEEKFKQMIQEEIEKAESEKTAIATSKWVNPPDIPAMQKQPQCVSQPQKSLYEIQLEQSKEVDDTVQHQVPTWVGGKSASTVFGHQKPPNLTSAWGMPASAPAFPEQPRVKPFWELDEEDHWPEKPKPKKQPPKPNNSRPPKQEQQVQPPPKQTNPSKTKKKKEEDVLKSLFADEVSNASKDPFYDWCYKQLTALNSTDVDVPTFTGFLMDIDSPYEVHDYVNSYLGESPEAKEFAKQFILEKNRRSHSNVQDSKLEDIIRQETVKQQKQTSDKKKKKVAVPEQVHNPSLTQIDESPLKKDSTLAKEAYIKRKKGTKINASTLFGISCNAAENRVNRGELHQP